MKYQKYLTLGILIGTIGGLTFFFEKEIGSFNTAYAQSQQEEVSIPEGAYDPSNNKFYEPDNIKANIGDTIIWTNNDSQEHTVTQNSFDSGIIASGQTFEHTFEEAGEFIYHCSIHPFMTGKVIIS